MLASDARVDLETLKRLTAEKRAGTAAAEIDVSEPSTPCNKQLDDDSSVGSLCDALGLTHLCEAAAAVPLDRCWTTLAASGRTALLAELATQLPAAKLPERQKLANAISKRKPPPPLAGAPPPRARI